MPRTVSRSFSSMLLASASVAALSLAWQPSPALAEKVGVASAVKPEATAAAPSSRSALHFLQSTHQYSGTGLVQVLLVDGSTFTVGPGSDLVIDKFVYDPNKSKGAAHRHLQQGHACVMSAARSPRTKAASPSTRHRARSACAAPSFRASPSRAASSMSLIFGEEATLRLGARVCFESSTTASPSI